MTLTPPLVLKHTLTSLKFSYNRQAQPLFVNTVNFLLISLENFPLIFNGGSSTLLNFVPFPVILFVFLLLTKATFDIFLYIAGAFHLAIFLSNFPQLVVAFGEILATMPNLFLLLCNIFQIM
jgi:hypothetical protein